MEAGFQWRRERVNRAIRAAMFFWAGIHTLVTRGGVSSVIQTVFRARRLTGSLTVVIKLTVFVFVSSGKAPGLALVTGATASFRPTHASAQV